MSNSLHLLLENLLTEEEHPRQVKAALKRASLEIHLGPSLPARVIRL